MFGDKNQLCYNNEIRLLISSEFFFVLLNKDQKNSEQLEPQFHQIFATCALVFTNS